MAVVKTWKVVVTELGSDDTLHEVLVEATNWMGALDAGRVHLGEERGVPPGASCAVAPDGQVTLHDPMGRRTYVLTPRRPSSRPPPPDGGAQATQGNGSKAPSPRESYRPKPPAPSRFPPTNNPVAKGSAPERRKGPKQKTIAYDASQLPRPAGVPKVSPGANPEMRPAATAASATKTTSNEARSPARPGPSSKPPRPSSSPPRSPAASKRPSAPARRRESGTDDEATSGEFWRRFVRTDRDPTHDNPLRYRERAYAVPPDTDPDDIEALLRERFAELRDLMADLPSGKFVNLAVFDHEWTHRPARPPVATLQWKDWRGVPEVNLPRPTPGSNAQAPTNPAESPRAVPPVTAPAEPHAAEGPTRHAQPLPPQPSEPRTPEPEPLVIEDPFKPQPKAQLFTGAPSVAPAATPVPAAEQPFRPRRPNTDEHDARLAHAFEAAQDLLFLQTPLEAMEFVIRLLTELIPTEAASGCLYDIDTDELRFVTAAGPGGDGRQGIAVPRRSGIMGVATTHEGLAMRVDEVASDPRFRLEVDGRDGVVAKNALYLALSHQGRLLGVIQLLNRENRPAFTESDANLLTYVGRQASAFLHKARIAPQSHSRH